MVRRDAVDENSARRGVASEQGALRPPHHFHPFNVHQFVNDGAGLGPIDPIHIQAHRRLQAKILRAGADAADGEIGRGRDLASVREQAGDILLQVKHIGDAVFHELLSRHGGHGHRDVLEALFAFLRGHHELLDAGFLLA